MKHTHRLNWYLDQGPEHVRPTLKTPHFLAMCPTCPGYGHKCFCHCGLLYNFYSSHAAGKTQNDISSCVLSMYVFVWCGYACIYVCEHGYTCVAFREHLGGWPLASALRQALLSIAVCVRLTGWKASRHDPLFTFHLKQGVRIIHTHSLSHPDLWGFWGFKLSSSHLARFTH